MKDGTTKVLAGLAALVAVDVGILHALLGGLRGTELRQTLSEFGGSGNLPLSTRVVSNPAWLWAVAIALVVGAGGVWLGLKRRPGLRLVASVALVLVGLAALWFTHWALRQPFVAIGGLLQPE
jgi:hypothetical protein